MKHITTILLATVVGAGLMSTAHAADLIVEQPVMPGVVDVGGNWDGLFIGAFGGFGWGLHDHRNGGSWDRDIDHKGFLVGVDAGANFTLTDGIIIGVVGDLAWANLDGQLLANDGGWGSEFNHRVNWMGSLRGRLGFDGGSFMPYLTAGVAFAGTERHSWDGNSEWGPFRNTHVGWTVGAGVEVAVADNLSVDLQYRFTDLGEKKFGNGDPWDPKVRTTTNAVTAGLHWRF